MKMPFHPGDFIKQVGGDAGIYFNGKTWIKFECLGCAYANKVLKNRLNNGDHRQLWNNRFGQTAADKGGMVLKHDPALHAFWLAAGKPVKFEVSR